MARKIIDDTVRDKRISLVLTPSTDEAIRTLALIKRKSVNEYVVDLLNRTASRNADVIAEFKAALDTAEKKIVDVDAD